MKIVGTQIYLQQKMQNNPEKWSQEPNSREEGKEEKMTGSVLHIGNREGIKGRLAG